MCQCLGGGGARVGTTTSSPLFTTTHYLRREAQPTAPPPPLPHHSTPTPSTPRFCVFVDREAQDSALYISWKVPARPTRTPGQYLEVLKVGGAVVWVLWVLCLAPRLYEITTSTGMIVLQG